MKKFCTFVVLLIWAQTSLAQYSFVYQIRHDNKEESRPVFRDLTEYKNGRPSEMGLSGEPRSAPTESPKTRDFEVKPGIGPNLMNAINKQNTEKTSDSNDAMWTPDPRNEKSSLLLQSNANSPIYSRQPSPRSYSTANELPLYGEKFVQESPKGYPILESPHIREQNRERDEPKQLSYSLSMPSPPLQRPIYRPFSNSKEEEQKMRTVHSIQTPNYKIQLVSQPEPLEQLIPLLKQYQLSTKPFQSQDLPYSAAPQSQSYSQMSHSQSGYSQRPSPPSAYPESGKALMVSIEPDARINEEVRSNLRDESKGSSIPSIDRHIYEERPKMYREFRPEPNPVPKPILDLPRQELPPQIRKLRGQSFPKLPPSEPRNVPLLQSRPQYGREELIPVTALYQMAPPNLAKGQSYSGVEYASDDESKRHGRQAITSYKEEPVIYRIIDSEGQEKSSPLRLINIDEQLEKLGRENPSAQKIFFEKIKADSVEMPERGQTKYLKVDEQPLIATDPNYKSSPLPEEYKPYTQTRYYKAYV